MKNEEWKNLSSIINSKMRYVSIQKWWTIDKEKISKYEEDYMIRLIQIFPGALKWINFPVTEKHVKLKCTKETLTVRKYKEASGRNQLSSI